jgi:hypothetical protein
MNDLSVLSLVLSLVLNLMLNEYKINDQNLTAFVSEFSNIAPKWL